MCGIGLIVSTSAQHHQALDGFQTTAEDLMEALKRRGPDTMGRHTLSLEPTDFMHNINNKIMTVSSDVHRLHENKSQVTLDFVATTLQLRGAVPISQPLKDDHNNVLIYNGEIFAGLAVRSDANDAQVLLDSLCKCCSCHTDGSSLEGCTCIGPERGTNTHSSVPQLLSTIKGPWALVFWQAKSRTLWFGRDVLGRRSLLVHWPSLSDQRLVFSSVSPHFYHGKSATRTESMDRGLDIFDYWEELPCGIYSISMRAGTIDNYHESLVKHNWEDVALVKLAGWERSCIEPPSGQLVTNLQSVSDGSMVDSSVISRLNIKTAHHLQVLAALQESVRRRTSNIFKHGKDIMKCFDVARSAGVSMEAPFAILFSGGLDSMILAAVADRCVAPHWSIDLLNVSFEGQTAPDRISAIAGIEELSRISPSRRWRLVEIDGDPSCLGELHGQLLSIICPSKTHMDLNIGTALWLAAQGHGWVTTDSTRKEYKSEARVVLVGSGADEQCAGYGRHRTKFREGGWKALEKEMQLDMQRLWKRNMGRDDRCIADHGKEARFPFLDEDVIHSLLNLPLWDIADLRQPLGQGDKKVLREIALVLGLKTAASLPKRAIQFGSRIAQESNRRNFGSNRAANQASAGSATLDYL